MPRLNETDRWRAVGMIEAGVRHTDVARQFGVHQNTVDAWWRRYQQFGITRDRFRSGRPRVTSNHQDTYIRVVHLRDRLRTATLTARNIPGLRRIRPRTVHNRLRERGIRPRRPATRPVLQQRHRVARFAWCRRHIHFRTGHVFFSRMNPGFISTAATVVLECTVVLVNVSMTVVWFSGVLSAEVVSWCGVESHPVAEQLLWL